jgi:hypothetical protein
LEDYINNNLTKLQIKIVEIKSVELESWKKTIAA